MMKTNGTRFASTTRSLLHGADKKEEMNPALHRSFKPKRVNIHRTFTIPSDSMPFSKVQGKRNQHKVTIYALSTCVWCKMTKQYLKDNEVEFEYLDVDLCSPQEKEEARKKILDKGGALSYPTTIVDDKTLITGFRKDLLKEALQL